MHKTEFYFKFDLLSWDYGRFLTDCRESKLTPAYDINDTTIIFVIADEEASTMLKLKYGNHMVKKPISQKELYETMKAKYIEDDKIFKTKLKLSKMYRDFS